MRRFQASVQRTTRFITQWYLLMIGVVLACLLGVFLFSPLFSVREIRLQRGQGRVNTVDVQKSLSDLFGRHLLLLSTHDVLGRVLEIGGLKEKVIAAHRAGITDVIIPQANVKDLREIPENVREDITFHPAEVIEDVLKVALVRASKKKSK
jgi:hypothetical protein